MRWTENCLIELKEKFPYYLEHKKEAENYFGRYWSTINKKASELGLSSMRTNKKCSQFLGCYVAERVLSHVFEDVKRMPFGNKYCDFICKKGFKIEVKSSCLNKNNSYVFHKLHNKKADYFILIAFDNRNDLNPQHVWLIKSNEIINKRKKISECISLLIINVPKHLDKYSKYELTDKLQETIECCTTLKYNNKSKEVSQI